MKLFILLLMVQCLTLQAQVIDTENVESLNVGLEDEKLYQTYEKLFEKSKDYDELDFGIYKGFCVAENKTAIQTYYFSFQKAEDTEGPFVNNTGRMTLFASDKELTNEEVLNGFAGKDLRGGDTFVSESTGRSELIWNDTNIHAKSYLYRARQQSKGISLLDGKIIATIILVNSADVENEKAIMYCGFENLDRIHFSKI